MLNKVANVYSSEYTSKIEVTMVELPNLSMFSNILGRSKWLKHEK